MKQELSFVKHRNAKASSQRKANRQQIFQSQRAKLLNTLFPLNNPFLSFLFNHYGRSSSQRATSMDNKVREYSAGLNKRQTKSRLQAIAGLSSLLMPYFSQAIQKIDEETYLRVIQLASNQRSSKIQTQAISFLNQIISEQFFFHLQKGILNEALVNLYASLLKSKDLYIIILALTGISNIACNSPQLRNTFNSRSGFQSILSLFRKYIDHPLLQKVCFTLSNLCRHEPLPQYEAVKETIPLFCQVIVQNKWKDTQTLCQCCWAISYHSMAADQAKIVKQSGILPHLIGFMSSMKDQHKVLLPTMRILGNIGTFDGSSSAKILQKKNIKNLEANLQSESKNNVVLNQTLSLLSKIANGEKQISSIIRSSSLINIIMHILRNGSAYARHFVCKLISQMVQHGNKGKVFEFLKRVKVIQGVGSVLALGNKKLSQEGLQCLALVVQLGEYFLEGSQNYFIVQLPEYLTIDLEIFKDQINRMRQQRDNS